MGLLGGSEEYIVGASEKQAKLLEAVDAHWQMFGQGPTHDEMAATIGVSRATVEWQTKKLIEAGLLTRVPGRHYDLRLTEKARV